MTVWWSTHLLYQVHVFTCMSANHWQHFKAFSQWVGVKTTCWNSIGTSKWGWEWILESLIIQKLMIYWDLQVYSVIKIPCLCQNCFERIKSSSITCLMHPKYAEITHESTTWATFTQQVSWAQIQLFSFTMSDFFMTVWTAHFQSFHFPPKKLLVSLPYKILNRINIQYFSAVWMVMSCFIWPEKCNIILHQKQQIQTKLMWTLYDFTIYVQYKWLHTNIIQGTLRNQVATGLPWCDNTV